jgi:hypothetical protein
MAPSLLLGVLLIAVSCGKKAPPFLPTKEFSLKITNLRGEWVDGVVLLKGDISGSTGSKKDTSLIKGVRVDYGQYPLKNSPCSGCPIEYGGFNIFGPEVVTEGGLSCKVHAKMRQQIYFFKVHLMGPDNSMGPPSNRIRLDVE